MSEPERLGNILPEVMRDIKGRCNRYRRKRGLPLIGEELERANSPIHTRDPMVRQGELSRKQKLVVQISKRKNETRITTFISLKLAELTIFVFVPYCLAGFVLAFS